MSEQEQDPCKGCMGDKEWGPKRDKCAQCPLLKELWRVPEKRKTIPDYELGGDPGEPLDRAGNQRDR